jgi:hypothetical protein
MSYDGKFREIELSYIEEGVAYGKEREQFKPGKNTIRDWIELRNETGGLGNRELKRGARKRSTQRHCGGTCGSIWTSTTRSGRCEWV